jgi:glycogen operon protein
LHRQCSRGAFANRLAGSSDVFGRVGRGPHSSVNFITAHDGFTLRDLVSYAQRHNQANGEDNRDGHADNLSTNNGVEGETDAPSVLDQRASQQRVLLATLVLSLGTPMLLAGDEFGHSQGGNNNAYCQDNPTTWINWARADRGLCAFVKTALALRQGLAVLQASHWWQTGASDQGPEALWWSADGQPMSAPAWDEPHSQALSLRLQGAGQGVLLLFNPEPYPVRFTLPPGSWRLRLNTAVADPSPPATAGPWLGPTEDVASGALWMAVAVPMAE